MTLYKNLTAPQKDLVRDGLQKVLHALADDPSGHIPNCGYADEKKSCPCFEMGVKLHQSFVDLAILHLPTKTGRHAE